jgi:hypothetical protein
MLGRDVAGAGAAGFAFPGRIGHAGQVQSLEPPDRHHFLAAVGWLELGNAPEAALEIAKIAPEFQAHPDVLELGWQIQAETKNWNACVEIAQSLVERFPDRHSGWLHRAYALRRATGGGLQAAWDALLPAAERFSGVYLIPYNLSCYACQMGRLPEARDWLKRAFATAAKAGILEEVRHLAGEDPDLEPLRNELRTFEP